MIGRVGLCPSYPFATGLDSDLNQTACSGGHLSMWENRCMHATVCLLRAGQPRRTSAAAKSGQFVGQFSWVTGDQPVSKGYTATLKMHCITLRDRQPFKNCWKWSVESFMSFIPVHERSRLELKPDCLLGWSFEYVRKSMYACHSVSVACRPAETHQRLGEIGSICRSILVGHRRPTGLKGLLNSPMKSLIDELSDDLSMNELFDELSMNSQWTLDELSDELSMNSPMNSCWTLMNSQWTLWLVNSSMNSRWTLKTKFHLIFGITNFV